MGVKKEGRRMGDRSEEWVRVRHLSSLPVHGDRLVWTDGGAQTRGVGAARCWRSTPKGASQKVCPGPVGQGSLGGGDEGSRGTDSADLVLLREALGRVEKDNLRLRAELEATEGSLREAAEEALRFRLKFEHMSAKDRTPSKESSGRPGRPDGSPVGEESVGDNGSPGGPGEAEGGSTTDILEKHLTAIQRLKERKRKLEALLQARGGPGGGPPGAGPARRRSGAAAVADGSPGTTTAHGEPVERAEPQAEADVQSSLDDCMSMLEGGAPQLLSPDEALAHAKEDAREEERHRTEMRDFEGTVNESDDVIREKEVLMDKLTRQSKDFHSMKARYEPRMQELSEEVDVLSQERERLLLGYSFVYSCREAGLRSAKLRRAASARNLVNTSRTLIRA